MRGKRCCWPGPTARRAIATSPARSLDKALDLLAKAPQADASLVTLVLEAIDVTHTEAFKNEQVGIKIGHTLWKLGDACERQSRLDLTQRAYERALRSL